MKDYPMNQMKDRPMGQMEKRWTEERTSRITEIWINKRMQRRSLYSWIDNELTMRKKEGRKEGRKEAKVKKSFFSSPNLVLVSK